MKIFMFLTFFLYSLTITAQNPNYLIGGADYYKVLNGMNFFSPGYGLHGGMQILKPVRTNSLQYGLEADIQYRRQCLPITSIKPYIDHIFFSPSFNLQINPFVRLNSGTMFLDAGLFANQRLLTLNGEGSGTVKPFDYGVTIAIGSKINVFNFALKSAFGLKNIRSGDLTYFTENYLHSLNLSFEIGMLLESSDKKVKF